MPEHLVRKKKYSGKDQVKCYLCPEVLKLSAMRGHVGRHILHALRNSPYTGIRHGNKLGNNPCGFCGRDGCITLLRSRPNAPRNTAPTILSTCDYHYDRMQYGTARKFSKSSPCTNVPIHCELCPQSAIGDACTIWKYNALQHIWDEHTSDGALPDLSPQLWIDLFITRAEEVALGILEEGTTAYRKKMMHPESDALQGSQPPLGARIVRPRSETASSIAFSDQSDVPQRKKSRLTELDEYEGEEIDE